MYPHASEWLASLSERAQADKLQHLDVLIDSTAMAYPLQQRLNALPSPPLKARLLDGLPEAALAEQGPILLRIKLNDNSQFAWLVEATAELWREQRLLVLLSAWPFETLGQHLSHHAQAEWDQGQNSGLLRYYDPRLFLATCEMLDPKQTRLFHAPAIAWYWLDRDGGETHFAGMPQQPTALPAPLPPLQLSNAQVANIMAWTSAELLRRDYALQPQDYALAKRESLIRHIVHAQLAADRAGRYDNTRDDYVLDWLAANSATAPAREEV